MVPPTREIRLAAGTLSPGACREAIGRVGGTAAGHVPGLAALHSSSANTGATGDSTFNFAAQLRAAKPMQCTLTMTRGLLILAASILLLSHPNWPGRFGRRRPRSWPASSPIPFAEEYLLPNAGRDWIISSSTVREFVARWLGETGSGSPPAMRPAPSDTPDPRGVPRSTPPREGSRMDRSEDSTCERVPDNHRIGTNRRPLPHLDRVIVLAAQPARGERLD